MSRDISSVLEPNGGVRRQRGRPTRSPGSGIHRRPREQITDAEAKAFWVALLHARHTLERPPTVHVTIQWRHAVSDTPAVERLQAVLNLFSNWSRRRAGTPPLWLYAREVGKLKGEHVHLLLHVPDHRISEFRKAITGWVEMQATGDVSESAVRVDRITPGTEHRLDTYFLKEAPDDVADKYGVPADQRRKRTGLTVTGKRLGVAHIIGPTARAAVPRP